ncbi:hypothetical protein [Mechercharimyces sp. CAU 1602]|uniref:hypothetical protein n=1 Tax=Mechercharimyces sp. CAU 1602 TaxID=2973933 RepID=UPI002163EEA8|nr:hypothetical protein [Mechercharimyces sp. CAU 1602]MCS1351929.1 hypothetical protein [Mechercharimyces sp. CAU 1602]
MKLRNREWEAFIEEKVKLQGLRRRLSQDQDRDGYTLHSLDSAKRNVENRKREVDEAMKEIESILARRLVKREQEDDS